MKHLTLITTLLTTTLILACNQIYAEADYEREQRLTDEVDANLFDGDIVNLQAAGRGFIGIETSPESEVKGTVLMVHGRGLHADWPKVTNPLRVGLVEHGWRTLSVQMPVLAKGALYSQYVPLFSEGTQRLDAALDYIKITHPGTISLLAHSCGVHMSMAWLKTNPDRPLLGMIGIGMGATDAGEEMAFEYPIKALKFPLTEIIGEFDYPTVRRTSKQRTALISDNFQQIELKDAGHYHEGVEDKLLETVASILDSQVK